MKKNSAKLIHLVQDSFFTDYVIKHFQDVNPDRNEFIYLTFKKPKPKFIKNIEHVKIVHPITQDFIKLIKQASSSQAILIHFLTPLKAWFALFCSKRTKLVWFEWGADFYNSIPKYRKRLYQSKTKKLIRKDVTHKWLTREIIVPSITTLFNPIKYVIGKIDFCIPVFYEEYKIIKPYLKKECEFLPFAYAIVCKKDFTILKENVNILLGNNALPSNNHMEALEILSELNLEERKIITPLSYGIQAYKKSVINHCPEKIRTNFQPLISFMPKEEYINTLDSCGIAVFNYNRQQGLGNIIELLANGCKVYINEETSTWQFFQRLGLKVFSIEKELHPNNPDVFTPLDNSTITKNKEIIEEEYSLENIVSKTRFCVDTLYASRQK